MKSMLEIIRALREDNDLTQRELAKALGITQQMCSQYETGTVELPLDIFSKLAEYYDVSADYLLGRTKLAEGKSFHNVYVTKRYSCDQLVEDVLSLSEAGRASVQEYIQLQKLKEQTQK